MWHFNYKWIFLFTIRIDMCVNVSWDKIKCSSDTQTQMPEGRVVDIGRFPWLGIVQHTFYLGGKTQYAVTGAVLVHPAYAIAPAEDMAKILPQQLINNTKLVLWRDEETKYALEVKDYILHPQYHDKVTFATIALLGLMTWGETGISDFIAPVLPVCMPITGSGSFSDLYAVKMTDETGKVGKEIIKMNYVDSQKCEEFYYQNELLYAKTTPVNPLCAKAAFQTKRCVWDSGVVLITRKTWGFWKLLGFGLRGPGCGLPARFLNIHDYLPWINDIISQIPFDDWQDTYKLVLRRISPIKLVMYKGDSVLAPKLQGQCDRNERGNVLFKDSAEILCNKNFAQGFYFLVITQMAEFLCARVELEVNSKSNAAVWIEHHCHRDVTGTHEDVKHDYQKRECFLYFKSAAFLEVRFFFSFKANIEITLYGNVEMKKFVPNPFKRTVHTTPWWPTWDKLKWVYFYPAKYWFWHLPT